MKIIKVKFWIGTRYVGSDVEEEVEIEVDEDASEMEIENSIEDYYIDWSQENSSQGWEIQED